MQTQPVAHITSEQLTNSNWAFRKHCLLNGLDDIGLTLQQAEQIKAYEAKAQQSRPWVFAERQA